MLIHNINSTKSMTGHLLGATGAIEAISCVLSIKNSKVPPTINHFTDDEKIDSRLNFTFNKTQEKCFSSSLQYFWVWRSQRMFGF